MEEMERILAAKEVKSVVATTESDDVNDRFTWDQQVLVLLAVEIPRAASGLPPQLLPHLWGVGVGRVDDHDGAFVGDEAVGDWGAGGERARLACLLLANGLCLYGHGLALLGLLSRLSTTMFAVFRYL